MATPIGINGVEPHLNAVDISDVWFIHCFFHRACLGSAKLHVAP